MSFPMPTASQGPCGATSAGASSRRTLEEVSCDLGRDATAEELDRVGSDAGGVR